MAWGLNREAVDMEKRMESSCNWCCEGHGLERKRETSISAARLERGKGGEGHTCVIFMAAVHSLQLSADAVCGYANKWIDGAQALISTRIPGRLVAKGKKKRKKERKKKTDSVE